jgi:hypothetical protein
MKTLTTATALFVAALILTPLTSYAQGQGRGPEAEPKDRAQVERGQRDLDGDRLRDRDRLTAPKHDRDRIQDRTHAPDFANLSDQDIYGNELMSAEERNQYRKQLQTASSSEQRARIEAQHRQEMQVRANRQGVDIAPPGQGIYGGAMMSVEERNRYREQRRLLESDPEKRAKFEQQHQEKMQLRAKAKGLPFDDLKETEEAE